MQFGCARKSPSPDCPGPVRQKKAPLSTAEKHPIFSKVGCFVFGGEELRPCGREFIIQHSKFKITWLAVRLQLRLDLGFGVRAATCGGHACDDKELRASAGRRLRPARS